MKANYTKIYILMAIILIMTSCNYTAEEKKDVINTTEAEVYQSRQNILTTLDSSEVFFHYIIKRIENQPDSLSEIKKQFEVVSLKLEKEVSKELKKINKLGLENKITNSEADKWLNDIQESKSIVAYKKIKHLLDSLESSESQSD
ncbi:hypothetical protein G3O08_11245 [Cryomorpha ignava]|uniref:DUF4296 domain-containing protein n=1 Tax=Cryomorpha ignava TaxID=101383 RepID=A0A7K3WTT5_9FLAO|nr:hypothetical protein [Cryomorpha ignava]NEN24075.1 hypothetical protein [Cryomorpha ignava]